MEKHNFENFNLGGKFIVEIKRKDGSVEVEEFSNIVTNEGKVYLLRSGISGETSTISTWYLGLIGANVTPTTSDTASTALGSSGTYQEVTDYTSPTRVQYICAYSMNPTQQINNNQNPCEFTFNSSVTVYGVFIVSNGTKGSNTGVLFCAGLFSSAKSMSNGETISIKYAITV